jgi:hypothetical protein
MSLFWTLYTKFQNSQVKFHRLEIDSSRQILFLTSIGGGGKFDNLEFTEEKALFDRQSASQNVSLVYFLQSH